MFDAAKTCRTCMKTDGTLVSLFDPWNVVDKKYNFQVADALVEVTTTQVAKEDGLPQCLCENCVKTLEISYTFRNQALKVDFELRKLFLLQSSVKNEPNEYNTEEDYTDSFDFGDVKTEDDEKIPIENVENTKAYYQCCVCKKPYKSKKYYLDHLATHKNKLQCSECNKQFGEQTSLDSHMSFAHTNLDKLINDPYKTDEIKSEVKIEIEPIDKNKLACKLCELEFEKPRSLASHMKKHKTKESLRLYKCNECDMVCSSKPGLRRHMKLHTNDKPYACRHCDKRYSRSDQLKDHLHKHDSAKANICPYCNKGFGQMGNLRDHIRTHTGETPYLCSECGKGFNNSSNLRQHMQRHTGIKSFSCNMCPKKFCTKGQMTVHLDTHTGAHPHKCEQCGASFTKPQSLKKHSLIHLGVKPYQCDVCPKRFIVKDHLTRHQRIHTGEKPYRCQYCSRAFTQSNDMTKHLRTHVGQNVYQCTVCEQRFRTQNDLKLHYPTHYVNGLAPEFNEQTSEDNTIGSTVPRSTDIDQGGTDDLVNGTDNIIIASTDDRLNASRADRTITITFNPDLLDKDSGTAGSITINM